ncbi:MAG: helix-turn-helix domain-containing protein [Clostridiaceae bacterium]|nr:helix-turn-helix domain-containing protein [Clostridiaceae bacterium]
MGIEERLNRLEEENAALKDRVAYLEAVGLDEFLPPKAIAVKMHCSLSTVHNYIKNGRIQATRKLGDWRIPTSQFYREDSEAAKPDVEFESMIRSQKKKKPEKETTMKDIVFGGKG